MRRLDALGGIALAAGGIALGLAGARGLMSGANAAQPAPADHDAAVTDVRASGSPNAYTFNVTIASNDTGCAHYADWWEVVDEHGALAYRRVLLHDHADEQPFTRDGGPVPIAADRVVTVRAHVHPTGYSGKAMRGSVRDGFSAVTVGADFAPQLERVEPQPPAC